jgi:hypothetical protein
MSKPCTQKHVSDLQQSIHKLKSKSKLSKYNNITIIDKSILSSSSREEKITTQPSFFVHD